MYATALYLYGRICGGLGACLQKETVRRTQIVPQAEFYPVVGCLSVAVAAAAALSKLFRLTWNTKVTAQNHHHETHTCID